MDEPVAWMIRENFADLGLWEERIIFTIVDEGRGTPLYMAQPQPKKKWVGLTKEEARELCVKNVPYVVDMVTALEARLKEKNT